MLHVNLLSEITLGLGIGSLDWGIIIVFLAVATLLAFATKGRQAGARDFFLSDRNLPWLAVCLSLMATEISAASFVGVPFSSFSQSLGYLQLAIGAILARYLVAQYLVPALYAQETFSPYHFVGRRLGFGAERMTSALFVVGAVLGQGVRVFIVAAVLNLITGVPIERTIVAITAFSALWAAIGGIRTVVWTNVLQFVVFVVAVLAAGVYLVSQTTGGLDEILRRAAEAGRTRLFDFRTDLVLELTIWTGLLGSTFNTLASHGADQMNAQHIFCCRNVNDAKKSMLWSSLSQVFVLLLLCMGLGLFCYYLQHEDDLNRYAAAAGRARVFPIFIATVLPAGLKGLLVVGLLAAAISSLSAALAALAQTTVRTLYVDVSRPTGDERSQVHSSRLFTLLWGVVLCLMAMYFQSLTLFEDLMRTALRSTSFTYGALLGAVLLAFVPHGRDGRGVVFAAPLAALSAFGMSLHEDWTHWIIIGGVGIVFAAWCFVLFREVEELTAIRELEQYVRRAWYILLAEFPRTIWVLAGIGLTLYLHFSEFYRQFTDDDSGGIAWPWYLPMGVGITVVLGYLLSRPKAVVAGPK